MKSSTRAFFFQGHELSKHGNSVTNQDMIDVSVHF